MFTIDHPPPRFWTSGSATDDDKEFCPCEKFVNLRLVRKTRVASRKKRSTVSQDATPMVAVTGSTSETVVARPRRSRKKKATFTTGGALPFETVTASQP